MFSNVAMLTILQDHYCLVINLMKSNSGHAIYATHLDLMKWVFNYEEFEKPCLCFTPILSHTRHMITLVRQANNTAHCIAGPF